MLPLTNRWLYAGKSCNGKPKNTPGTIRTGWGLLRRRQLCSIPGRSVPSLIAATVFCFDGDTDYDISTWNEKITDSLNYLFLLKAIIKEGHTNQPN